jgi:antitoxin PrlF
VRLRDGEVVLTRAETEHEAPVIGAFLNPLKAHIRKARAGTLECCPKELARPMHAN